MNKTTQSSGLWPVLVVDDDPDIQALTEVLLSEFEFENRAIDLIQANSAVQAQQLLSARADIAVVLLDVVMETETAGLELVSAIREDLNNHLIRIILRTGRQERAPAREVVAQYEIDAYHAKTELDPERLFSQLAAALRTYRVMCEMQEQRDALASTLKQRDALEVQLRHAQKLEAVGRLGAGIAHEINTPVQFVSDNMHFVQSAIEDLTQMQQTQGLVFREALKGESAADDLSARWQSAEEEADLVFLQQELPQAVDRSLEGLARIAEIVQSMREFAHPGQKQASMADLNRLIGNSLTVASGELKHVAEVVTEYGELPSLRCFPGELNQALLNIVINAAQAMRDSQAERGTLRIRTWSDNSSLHIAVDDTGPGIPIEIREKIFDPFFTTKDVGDGSGQGLTIAYNVVVKLHGGDLRLVEDGPGAHFRIRLPLNGPKVTDSGG